MPLFSHLKARWSGGAHKRSYAAQPITHAAATFGVTRAKVSAGALTVVKTLQTAGFDGYLVGGCVRDLLLGRQPKDYDVTTNAPPQQVKRLFGRARIIGRRFKIVHVYIRRERIEVATYRAAPRKTHRTARILDDNVYGSIEQDAQRRDFTINALYYDPLAEQIRDYVDGLTALDTKTLTVIGDIAQRFVEDPVRMLRAIRFQTKLALQLPPPIPDEIRRHAVLLREVPPARLLDEALKLFHHDQAPASWDVLRDTPLLDYLLPQTMRCIAQPANARFETFIYMALQNTALRIQQDKPVIASFLFAVLLWRPYQQQLKRTTRHADPAFAAAEHVFQQQSTTITLPWRIREPVLEIWELQPRLEQYTADAVRPLLAARRFRAAYDFLLLRSELDAIDARITDFWTDIQQCRSDQQDAMIESLPSTGGTAKPNKPLWSRAHRQPALPAKRAKHRASERI